MKDKNVAGSRMGSISNGVKKTTLILSVLSFFALASTAFAQGFVPLAPIPGLTEGATADTAGLANFFNNLYKYLIGLAAALAVIEIIWGGLEISTQDSVSKNKDGKDRIYQAIFGLVLVLSPVLVFSIINPSILNLSLNLQKLDTASTAPSPVPSGTGTGDTTTATAAGCSVSLNQGVVGCPTQAAADAWVSSCSNGTGRVYLSNEASLPYAATCNVLQPFRGNQNYTDKTTIPAGLWCFKTEDANKPNTIVYTCGASKDACDTLAMRPPLGGRVFADCASPPPN